MTLRPCVHIAKSTIDETLASAPLDGKRLLDPLKTFSKEHGSPVNILEDKDVANDAEVHMHEADLWFCLEGQVTFEIEGTLHEPVAKVLPDGTLDEREWKSKTIDGGRTVVLNPGDWLWIPAGQPHQHRCVGVARLVIIKVSDSTK